MQVNKYNQNNKNKLLKSKKKLLTKKIIKKMKKKLKKLMKNLKKNSNKNFMKVIFNNKNLTRKNKKINLMKKNKK